MERAASRRPGPPTQLGETPNDLVAADFNGDGTTDLAIPNVADFNTTILLNEFTQTATASVSNITIAGTGTHYVDAVYAGDTSFATSTSPTIPLQGSTVATTLTLTASPDRANDHHAGDVYRPAESGFEPAFLMRLRRERSPSLIRASSAHLGPRPWAPMDKRF